MARRKKRGPRITQAKKEGVRRRSLFDSEYHASQVLPATEEGGIFGLAAGVIQPLYDPAQLWATFEVSSILRAPIEALAVNVDGMGHELVPAIEDIDTPEGKEMVRHSIMQARMFDGNNDLQVSDEALTIQLKLVEKKMLREQLQLELFFEQPSEESFTELRMRSRIDLEVTGNAYWEIVRNGLSQVAEINYASSANTRLMVLDPQAMKMSVPRKVSKFDWRRQDRWRRPRRFVQVVDGVELTYFKELGDLRLMSSSSGRFYPSTAAMRASEGGVPPANEMIHHKHFSPVHPYGLPKWLGVAPSVQGQRLAEEVNVLYFRRRGIPNLIITVSGGKLAKDGQAKLTKYFEKELKDVTQFHAPLVIEAMGSAATPGSSPPAVKIEVKPLMSAIQQDALFLKYMAHNEMLLARQYRIPPILRGDTKDFNRSTSEAALEFSEQQIFAPERARFDHLMNDTIFSQMQIGYWRFQSLSPVATRPQDRSEQLLNASAFLKANEMRKLSGAIFGGEFAPVDEAWGDFPPDLLKSAEASAAALVAGVPGAGLSQEDAAKNVLTQLASMRDSLRKSATLETKEEGKRVLIAMSKMSELVDVEA